MRGRRDKGRGERQGDDRVQYRMRQRLVSVGDDFWIETDGGERAYKVDGKALRLRKTLVLEDAQGHEVLRIREKMLRIKDSMEIEDADGARVALASTPWSFLRRPSRSTPGAMKVAEPGLWGLRERLIRGG